MWLRMKPYSGSNTSWRSYGDIASTSLAANGSYVILVHPVQIEVLYNMDNTSIIVIIWIVWLRKWCVYGSNTALKCETWRYGAE